MALKTTLQRSPEVCFVLFFLFQKWAVVEKRVVFIKEK